MTRADHRRESRLEICVESLAGVEAAIAGGADRIELCSALALGGLTPSAGLAAMAVARCAGTGVRVHAMVRPRGGDFAYDQAECDVAIAEARELVDAGVDGLVFGACTEGLIDINVVRRWLAGIAGGRAVSLTFHRAIDVVADPVAAVETVAALGFDRILTSGGATTAPEGVAVLRAMVARAGETCTIVAGSGVRPETMVAVLASGVREVHASASVAGVEEAAQIRAMGFATGARRVTDMATVTRLKNMLDDNTN